MVSHHLDVFGGHWFSVSGDTKYLIYHVTLQNQVMKQDHVIKGEVTTIGALQGKSPPCQVW